MLPKNHTDSVDQSDSIGLYLQFESLSNVKTTKHTIYEEDLVLEARGSNIGH